jgi:hypothetical protein
VGDWFVAVGTGTAWSNTGAEEITIRTSANSEIALVTTGTLIHNRVWPGRHGFDSSWCMSSSVAGLFTGIAAEPATAR